MTAQFKAEMARAWAVVDQSYSASDVLGPTASQTVLRMATRAAHHDLPVGLSLMAGLVACTNGASIEIFPGSASPLALAVLNVNFPQTRKSAGYGLLSKLGREIDLVSTQRLRNQLGEDAPAVKAVRWISVE